MDVIALDQAGIGEVVAPLRHRLTEAQLERLWRLDGQPICCFDGDSAGQKAAVRAGDRALPHARARAHAAVRRAARRARTPTTWSSSGGREAIEALLASPEPLVERLWRHEVESAPLDTPEARAGLKQRLMEHVQAIGDPSVRQLYRDEWLRRFDALVRPQAPGHGRSLYPRREWKKQGGRFVPPNPPTAGEHPRRPAGAASSRRSPGPAPAASSSTPRRCTTMSRSWRTSYRRPRLRHRCATSLVQIAMSGQHLDRDGLKTILAAKAAGGDVRRGAMRFSFTQQGSNPEVALNDLGAALEAVIARTRNRGGAERGNPAFGTGR